MFSSIYRKLKKENKFQNSIFFFDLYKYSYYEVNLNNFLIEDYFKKPQINDSKKFTNNTGIPYEVFCQVGDYLYQRALKNSNIK